jgi:hypothetical protein
MAEGFGKTLDEALDDYASKKAPEFIAENSLNERSFSEVMDLFEATYHPIDISVQLRPHNQWVKGFSVKDHG